MTLENPQIKRILEAAIFSAEDPINVERLLQLFGEEEKLAPKALRDLLQEIAQDYEPRGLELKEIASGYRFQVRADLAPWLMKLQEERPPRYSRAFLETLALIAYRQPITRAEIEDIRGVVVSSYIIKTLLEREWIKAVGHKEAPGRPSLFATTKQFLDYFNLKNLSELPSLPETKEEQGAEQLALELGLGPEFELEPESKQQRGSELGQELEREPASTQELEETLT
jgi:segregation and condensation protein B